MVAQASPLVSVTTDRTWYAPGEQVQITITVNNTDEPWLWLYIDKPDRHNAYFAPALEPRTQIVVWDIPANATEGTYTVTVTWDHEYAQTDFTVQAQPIPEFPIAPMVFFLATAATVLALSWRKTSARSETLTPHP